MDYRSVRADLHLHTTASDGCWTPEQLVDEVSRAGIGLFAVTDHDSLSSLAEAADRARARGLRFLPGVELSSMLNGQWYHLLAYGFDPGDEALLALAAANEARLDGINDEAVRILIAAGHPISWDDYAAYTWDRRRGGWKAFNYALDRGLCHDTRGYFGTLFADLAYPGADFPPPAEVVAAVKQAGGVVVLAHPGAYFNGDLGYGQLETLVEVGVEGIECYSFHHDAQTTRRLLDYCHRRGLLITGGSDCHGGFVGRALGVPPVRAGDLRLGALEGKVIT